MNPEKMDDATRSELLNAEVDGVATESQRAALQGLLQRDPAAREELEALRAVADLLGRTPAPEAPDDFTDSVMTAVHRVRESSWLTRLTNALVRAGWSWGPQREDSTNLSLGQRYVSAGVGAPKRSREDVMARQQNMFQRRMIFAGAGVLAVAALVVYFGGYYPPAKEEALGTIGQAERYRSTQITATDVKLDSPEVQAFLQSEAFDRIVRDPAARQALSNEDLQKAIAQDFFADAMVQSARLGSNLGKIQGDAIALGRNAAELERSIKSGPAGDTGLDKAAMDLAQRALELERSIKSGPAGDTGLDKAAAELTSQAMELQRTIKSGPGGETTLAKDAMQLATKAAELQRAASLNQAAMDLNAKAIEFSRVKPGDFKVEYATLNQGALDLSAKALEFSKQVKDTRLLGDASKLDQAAMDLSAKAIEFSRIKPGDLRADASKLDSSAMELNSKALEFAKQVKIAGLGGDAALLSKTAMELNSKAIEFARIKPGDLTVDATRLNQGALDLSLKALELQKAISSSRLDQDALALTSKALELQKALTFGRDAAKLDLAAGSLNAQAMAFTKKINLLGDANKLNALNLDAKALAAISDLARANALNQVISNGAAFQAGRGASQQ